MKFEPSSFLRCGGGLGLIAGIVLWSGASHAQGYCYLVGSDGEVINLDDLCQSESTPPQPEASSVGEAAAESQPDTPPRTRSYIFTGPADVPSSGEASVSSPEAMPGDANDTAPAENATPAENRLDIPVREIPTPQIPTPQTQSPQTQDSSVEPAPPDVISDRPVNDTLMRGTTRIVVPSAGEPGN